MSVDYFTRVQASEGWARVLESFVRFVNPRPGHRALDVGCGPGALVRRLAELGCQATGVDADPAMVSRARELSNGLPNVEFRAGNVLAIPFAAGEIDLVTATNVIFLLTAPLAGLKEMARVCGSGGVVAMLNPSPRLSRAAAAAHAQAMGLTDFDAFSLASWGSAAEAHHRFSAGDVRALFANSGLPSPEITEKIGPGLALFAKAQKP
jgi:ubiquinone/menaquinone biosynthesis C-methylase UbiE